MEQHAISIRRPSFNQPWGMNLRKDELGRGTLIQNIQASSPVVSSGIHQNDVITNINGNDISKQPIERVQEQFAKNTLLALSILRKKDTTVSNNTSTSAQNTTQTSAPQRTTSPAPIVHSPRVNDTTTSTVAPSTNPPTNPPALNQPGISASQPPQQSVPSSISPNQVVIDLISDDEDTGLPRAAPSGTQQSQQSQHSSTAMETNSDQDEDEDEDEDDFDSWRRNNRGGVRWIQNMFDQGARNQSTANRSRNSMVIDLISDDDDAATPPVPRPAVVPSAVVPSATRAAPVATSRTAPISNTTQTLAPQVTAASVPSQTPQTDPKIRMMGKIKVKMEFEPKGFGEANIGDEVIEVEDPNKKAEEEKAKASKRSRLEAFQDDNDDEDDIEIIGDNMITAADMPHQREACTKFAFNYYYGKNIAGNQLFCTNCYCYICEVKASECLDWKDHCCANYKEARWKRLRDSTNTPILKLMSPVQKTAFLAKYAKLLSADQPRNSGYYGDSDEDDDDGYGYMFGHPYNGTSSNNSSTAVMNECIETVKEFLHRVENALIIDEYMNCSALIVRMIGLKTSFKYDVLHGLIIEWLLHPLCRNDVRDVLKNELVKSGMVLHTNLMKVINFLPSFITEPNKYKHQIPQELFNLPDYTIAALIVRVAPIADFDLLQTLVNGNKGSPAQRGKIFYALAQCNNPHCDAILMNYLQPAYEEAFVSIPADNLQMVSILKVLAMMIDINIRKEPIKFINSNTIYSMISALFKKCSITYPAMTWVPFIDKIRENRFLVAYFQSPTASFHEHVIKEVINVTEEFVRSHHLMELILAIFIITLYQIQSEVTVGLLQPSQVDKLKRFGHHLVMSWVCANACVTWAFQNPNSLDAQHDRYLQAGIVLLHGFLSHCGVESCALYQQMHIAIQVELQRLPFFTSSSAPSPPSTSSDTAIVTEGSKLDVEYVLARHAGTNRHQPIRETIQFNSKDAFFRYIFVHDNNTSNFNSGTDPLPSKLRHRIIGDYLNYQHLHVMMKVIVQEWEKIEETERQKKEVFVQFFRSHLLLFRIAWKGMYFALREDAYAGFSYSLTRSDLLMYVEGRALIEDWKIHFMDNEDVSNSTFLLVFCHHLSILAQPGLKNNFAKYFMETVAKVKEEVVALPTYLHDLETMSMVEMDVVKAAQFWYLGDTEHNCQSDEFFWKEWKKPLIIISNLKARVESEQMLMGIMMEDWLVCEHAMYACAEPMLALAKSPYASLQWHLLSENEANHNCLKVAEIVEKYLKTQPNEFRTYPEQNMFSKYVLQYPDSILTKISLSLSSSFINLHVNSPIPVIHWLSSRFRTTSSKYEDRLIYFKALEYIKKAGKLSFPAWAKYCVFLCGAFLGRADLLHDVIRNDFDNTMAKNYEHQHQGVHQFFNQLFLHCDEVLVGNNIKVFLAQLTKLYGNKDSVAQMKDVVARVERLVTQQENEHFSQVIASGGDASDVALISTPMEVEENGSQSNSFSTHTKDLGLGKTEDLLYFHMVLFFHYYNDESFSKLWTMIKRDHQQHQHVQKIVTDFMEQIAATNRYLVSNHLKILFIMMGSGEFINFLPSIKIETASLNKMEEMLTTILELLPRFETRLEEVFVFVVKGITRLNKLPEVIIDLIVKNIEVQNMFGFSTEGMNEFAENHVLTIPHIDAEESHQPCVTKTFAKLFFLAIKYPRHIRAYLQQLQSFEYFQTTKLHIFQLLTNPKDTRYSLTLLVENRIYQAIPTFLLNQINHSNPSRSDITALTESIYMLNSLITPTLLLAPVACVAEHSTTPVTMEGLIEEWKRPDSLLRTLFPCLLQIQLQFYSVKDVKQQHPDALALKKQIEDLIKTFLSIIALEKSMLGHYVCCMLDIHHHLKDFVQAFMESELGKASLHYREIVQSQGLPFTDWNPILQEVFTCDLKGANFYALLKISRLLVELKKRKLLENVVEIFSSDEKFHRHILQLYTLPCSVWIGSHNQEKQVEGGIVQASRTLPTINESIIKYLTETIQKLGKTAARTFESITILMLLGYDPSDPNAVQNSTRNMDSQLQAVTKTWLDFAKLVNATMESKSVVMRCTIMLLESTNSDALIPTAIKNIPSFYKDPAFPVWSAFFLHVLQSRIRPSFQQLLLLFDFQASYNPPLFPQQMEALFNNSVYFDDKILYVADSLVNKLLNNSKILEAVFCRPHVTGTLIEDDTNLHCLLSRAKLLEALCKAQPDANMAKRVGKLIEALGNYSRTQSMIAGRKHLVTECVSVLRILMQHFTGDEKVYLISQKTMIVKWLKSKKAVAEICMTL